MDEDYEICEMEVVSSLRVTRVGSPIMFSAYLFSECARHHRLLDTPHMRAS